MFERVTRLVLPFLILVSGALVACGLQKPLHELSLGGIHAHQMTLPTIEAASRTILIRAPWGEGINLGLDDLVDFDGDAKPLSQSDIILYRRLIVASFDGLIQMSLHQELLKLVPLEALKTYIREVKLSRPIPVRISERPDDLVYLLLCLHKDRMLGVARVADNPSEGRASLVDVEVARKVPTDSIDELIPSLRRPSSYQTATLLGGPTRGEIERIYVRSNIPATGIMDFYWRTNRGSSGHYLSAQGVLFSSQGRMTSMHTRTDPPLRLDPIGRIGPP